jgi:3-oxoacyl-[acyl-carrier-protein] synthase II
MKRVVITGLGALTPIGNNVPAFLKGLQEGLNGADWITKFDTTLYKTKFGCEVKGLDPEQFMDRKDIRHVDHFTLLGIIAADEAVKDAGFDMEKLDPDRIGVIIGTGIGGLRTLENEYEAYVKGGGTPRFSPFLIPKMIADICPGHISIKYGFRGINYSTVSACASSTHALMNAFDYIRMGRNDIILAGGAESTITPMGVGGFNSMKALSTRNDDFKTASRPFDRDRDGFVIGEGAGVLVLEELEHARRRGAKIYGEIVGAAATADAYHITAPHPEGLGARKVMELTLKDAKMNVEDIDYINVHGTSTPLGDIAEAKAIQQVFGDAAYGLNISSTKSMMGHLLGAAGAVEAIAGVLAINHNFIPPTINHFTDDPEIDPKLNLTFNEAQEKEVRAFLSNTFGFGGHNSSIIVKKFEG